MKNSLSHCYRLAAICLAVSSAFVFGSVSRAQVPRTISYQGLIADRIGAPISDGDHTVTVSFYADSTGGTALYSESHSTQTHGGVFSILIGSKLAMPSVVKFNIPLYLGVSVDGKEELYPRTAMASVPYALHAEVAELSRGLTSDAQGVVTSINEIAGPLDIVGDSTINVSQTGRKIQLHSVVQNSPSQGIIGVSATDKSILVQNSNGPIAGVRVADSGITTQKIADGAVTPSKINQAGATNGQVLKWNGFKWVPSDVATVYTPGTDITIFNNTISVAHPLPQGTSVNTTLRWDGASWVENPNLTSTNTGLTTVNNSLYLSNSGLASELRFYESAASGGNYTAFHAASQLADITYTLPASLPAATAYLSVSPSGVMSWGTPGASQVGFDQILSGTNQNQTLTVGNGTVLAPSGTGVVTANRFIGTGSTSNAVDLGTAEVSGVLPIANGGTNSGTALGNNRLMYSTAGSIIEFASGNSGQVLVSGGAAAPSWTTVSLLPNGTFNNATLRWDAGTSQWVENTNVLSSAAGLVTVSAGINLSGVNSPVLANNAAGTSGQVLTSGGPGATPSWTTIAVLPTGTTTSSTLRWNGANWVEDVNVLESAAGMVTVSAGVNFSGTGSPLQLNASAGTSGQVLTSAGAGVTPTWTTINTLPTGTTTNSTLRWNGTNWVENTNVLSTAAGQVTVSAGVNLGGAASPLLLNNAAGTSGQFLTSAGAGTTPTWTTGSLLPNGTVTNSTLRWNGTNWVENTNVLSTAAGQVTANAGANLSGTTSPLLLNNAAGTSGQVLTSAGAGATPTWTTVNILPTGTTTNSTLRWNGSNWVEDVNVLESAAGMVTVSAGVNLNGAASPLQLNASAGTSGQVLTSAGAAATPTWTTINLLPTGTITNSTLRWNGTNWVENTNVLSTAAGQVTVSAGANFGGTTSPLLLNNAAGTSGQVLTSAGAGATPTWTTVNLLPTGTTTNSTLRWNGSNWVEDANVLESAAGMVTVSAGVNLNGAASPLQLNASAGTSGQVLTSAGAAATPTWTTINLLPTGTTTNSTLRWNGTNWVENTNVLSTAAGQVTANAGLNLSGTTSTLLANNVAGTSGQVLTSAGAGATPTWSTVNVLSNGTVTNSTLRWNGSNWVENTNVLASSTGQVTNNAGENFNGAASPILLNNSAGTSGQVLTSAGAGVTPSWTSVSVLPSGTTTNSTLRWNGSNWVEDVNVLESVAGMVTVSAGVNLGGTSSPLQVNASAGTSGQVLTSAGAGSTPTWTSVAILPTGTTVSSTLRWNGSNWVENTNVLASAAGQVTMNAGASFSGASSPILLSGSAGTSGQFLTSAGAGATPSWTTGIVLSPGTVTSSTLRWNGVSWVENTNVLSTAVGQLTVNAGMNFNTTASPLLMNNVPGTSGQVLTSAGAGTTPTWTTLNVLPTGTTTNSTLRWNGSNWVEDANVLESAAGQVTVSAGVNLSSTASPLLANNSAGTAGQVLTSAGAGATPTWTTVAAIANGTINNSTLRWNGSNWVENTNVLATAAGQVTNNAGENFNGTVSPILLNSSAGTSGQVLTSAGAGVTPTWTTINLLPSGTITNSTLRWNGANWVEDANVLESAAGQVTVSAGVNFSGTTSPLQLNGAPGVSGQFLTSAGAGSTPTWVSGSLLTNGTATDNTLRWNGSNWVETALVKSSSTGQVTVSAGVNLGGAASPLLLNNAAGTSGQMLTSAGAGTTPTWTTVNILPTGTVTNSTLRWNGANWVENANVLETAVGQVTVSAGVNLGGAASPLLLNNAAGTSGQFLTSAGAGATPTWTTGALLSNGTATDNTLRWNGSNWVETNNVRSSAGGLVTVIAGVNLSGAASPLYLAGATGASGQMLTSAGAGATPTWTTVNLLPTGTTNNSTLRWNGANWVENTNVLATAAGLVTVSAGVNLLGAASPLLANNAAGTAGQVLTSAGAGATPTWTTIAAAIANGTATDNTLRWNGANWVETANVTSSAAGLVKVNAGINLNGASSPILLNNVPGTSGFILTSAGAGATPTWTDPSSLVGWKVTGNSGTTPGTGGGQNYMGTTDNKDVVFAANALEHIRITSSGVTTASAPSGVIHARGVLPGGGSSIKTGMTVETVFPSGAGTSGFAVGGLFSNAAVTNSVALGANDVFCAFNSTMTLNGSAGTTVMRANDGVAVVDNVTAGLTHASVIGHYGTVRTGTSGGGNTATVTVADAFRANFVMNNVNGTFTTANGLFVENPTLGGAVPSSSIGTFNGIYVQNLTTGTTKRAFLYDGTGANVPVAITDAGKVGIGRKDPTQALEVYNGNVLISNNTNTAGLLTFAEPSGSGANISTFAAQAQAADINYILPAAQPTANQLLTATSVAGAGPYTVTLGWSSAGAGSGWGLTGNAGTTAGTNFVGTTDNIPFEVHVFETDAVNKGSRRVMRYEPNATSANILGGYNGNTITNAAIGVVIAGGGSAGNINTASDSYATIGGGTKNAAGNSGGGNTYATIAGGFSNSAIGKYSTIAGGTANSAQGLSATIGGGQNNTASNNNYVTIAGGNTNTASAPSATVGGGDNNTASGTTSTIGGGTGNTAAGQYSTISGGKSNNIPSATGGDFSVIAGGENLTLGANSFGVNQGAAVDVSATSFLAYFGNMSMVLANTAGTPVKFGVNTSVTPNTVADINGDVATREGNYTAANGVFNHNINVGGKSFIRITGPGAAYTIDGITGGVDGKIVILYNSVNQTMTLTHDDANSAVGNRIFLKGAAANVQVGRYGVVTLIYNSTDAHWIMVSSN